MPPREFRQGPTPFTADGWQGSLYPGAVKDFVGCTTVDTVYLLQKTSVIIFAASQRISKQRGHYESSRRCLQIAIRCRGRRRRARPLEIPASRINVLTPEMTDKEIAASGSDSRNVPNYGE